MNTKFNIYIAAFQFHLFVKLITNTLNAIVTTLRNPGESLFSFIKYHLAIGFDHIFLFFDDANDAMIKSVEDNPAVTIVKNDPELQSRWFETVTFRSNQNSRKFLDTEVMARQILNVEVAIDMAKKLNIKWLLHIDHDELFTTNNISVAEHFSKLTDQGITSIRYVNHEAIPETLYVQDPFRDATLFKKNAKMLKRDQGIFLKSLSLTDYFLFYSNGKSAGLISSNLAPNSVHDFKNQDEYDIAFDAFILHYPINGLERFIDKYRVLGQFDDKWFGTTNIKDQNPFHIACRDIINQNDENLADQFYRNRVMWNPELVNNLIEKGILYRDYKPQDILRGHNEI